MMSSDYGFEDDGVVEGFVVVIGIGVVLFFGWIFEEFW